VNQSKLWPPSPQRGVFDIQGFVNGDINRSPGHVGRCECGHVLVSDEEAQVLL
jgi:hypothetical protein